MPLVNMISQQHPCYSKHSSLIKYEYDRVYIPKTGIYKHDITDETTTPSPVPPPPPPPPTVRHCTHPYFQVHNTAMCPKPKVDHQIFESNDLHTS
jgi:hypothetical protein